MKLVKLTSLILFVAAQAMTSGCKSTGGASTLKDVESGDGAPSAAADAAGPQDDVTESASFGPSLTGTWKNSNNPAIFRLEQDGLGQVVKATIDTAGAPGLGFGTLKRVNYGLYAGAIDQKNPTGCVIRYFYEFEIQGAGSMNVWVKGSNGACQAPTAINTIYTIVQIQADAPPATTLTGDWKNSNNAAIFRLEQDPLGQEMKVVIDNHGAPGGGFGQARRVSATSYDAQLDQKNAAGCVTRYFYSFTIDGSDTLQVNVKGSNGACNSPTALSIVYTVARMN